MMTVETDTRSITIQSDGAARGNPGPAGLGVIIKDAGGEIISSYGSYIGEATNNVAEYEALLSALETVKRFRAEKLIVLLDSELLVKQLRGEYRVKNPGLKPLHAAAVNYLSHYPEFSVRHVPRSENQAADELANQAIDEHYGEAGNSSDPGESQGTLF